MGEGGPAWSLKRWVTATKKNEILPFAATWTDLEIIIPAEGNQAEKDKYLMIHKADLCVESKKKDDTNQLAYKTETESQR